MKILLSAAIILSVFCFSHAEDRLKLSVYYESLCQDCKNFFSGQLQPTYDELADYIVPDLVPFGKGTAKKNGDKWEFTCQHGDEECNGNKYHSCAVKIATAAKALTFATCAVSQEHPASDETFQLCAKKAGISYDSLKTCKDTKGDELLAANAERSNGVGYQTVPAIAFNGNYDAMYSLIATTSLKKLVCSFLSDAPPQCGGDLI